MYNTLSQSLAEVNQSCSSVSAQLQVKLQYQSNLFSNMLTAYQGILKSDNDMLTNINKQIQAS
jgi:primosomal protein N''